MRVIVQGNGVVGRATTRILERAGHKVEHHDPPLGLYAHGPAEALVMCTLCPDGTIPTPAAATPILVVRSTVTPDALAQIPGVHHWPEFLTERTAEWDADNPDKIVWGHDGPDAPAVAERLLSEHYRLAPALHCSTAASALIKLGVNAHYTAKVLLANALYDACGAHEGTYQEICKGLHLDRRLTPLSHANIWQDGYRGAGGKCLPKDLGILAGLLEGTAAGTMLEALAAYNNQLRAQILEEARC
jgi:UDP-glucose 6-dehydrogenase